MPTVLTALIDKQDNFEVVRDQIAALINLNQAAQVILATAAAEPDPSLWKLRVFTERAQPWEQVLNEPEKPLAEQDLSPIVNVWYENGTFPEAQGDTVKRQAHTATYNVDVYGFGIDQDVVGGGHIPGDLTAVRNATRGIRLVRNILMAAENIYLQLRNKDGAALGPGVWQRWVQSITSFQPDLASESAHAVIGIRLALRVTFNEYSPQVDESNALETVHVDVQRASDGMLIVDAEYDFT